jgi:hypothetical protein
MAEHVVEHVGFLQVIELVRPTDEIARDEAAVGTSPGTATTCQPVNFISRSDNSSKSGMPGLDSLSTSSPRSHAFDARPGSSFACRANSVSQVACSSAV